MLLKPACPCRPVFFIRIAFSTLLLTWEVSDIRLYGMPFPSIAGAHRVPCAFAVYSLRMTQESARFAPLPRRQDQANRIFSFRHAVCCIFLYPLIWKDNMKHCRGFTLIELMIVVAIIAVIAAIAIPSLLNARRNSNSTAALQTMNSFYKASTAFSIASATNLYWEDGTTDFGGEFHHVTPKFAHEFRYFSNDTTIDTVHSASKFIYLAVPVSVSGGLFAYYCTEHHSIYKSNRLTEAQIAALKALTNAAIIFDDDGSARINIAGITFAPVS